MMKKTKVELIPLTEDDKEQFIKDNQWAFKYGAVEEFGMRLGLALANVSCVVDPEVFVIGGGVSRAGQIILDVTKKYYQKYAFHACRDAEFALAKLGNDAGIYGGAAAVL